MLQFKEQADDSRVMDLVSQVHCNMYIQDIVPILIIYYKRYLAIYKISLPSATQGIQGEPSSTGWSDLLGHKSQLQGIQLQQTADSEG